MEGVLWYLFASSRGSANRVRLVRTLAEQPRNANQLAEELDLDYKTVQHHLEVLMDNNVVRRTDNDYAAVYLFTDQVKTHWDLVEDILETVDPVDGETDGEGPVRTDPGTDPAEEGPEPGETAEEEED